MSGQLFDEHVAEIDQLLNDAAFKIKATLHEVGGTAPVSIIRADQNWFVEVNWEFTGRITHHICGNWYLALLLESEGPGDDYSFPLAGPQGPIPMDPVGNGKYTAQINVNAGDVFAAPFVGSAYTATLVFGSQNMRGESGVVFARCKGGLIQITP